MKADKITRKITIIGVVLAVIVIFASLAFKLDIKTTYSAISRYMGGAYSGKNVYHQRKKQRVYKYA